VAGGKRINKVASLQTHGAVQEIWDEIPARFGATQVDLTLRRQFQLRERLSLQARADFFNISITPIRTAVNYLSSPLSGNRTQMLEHRSKRRPDGGLNPLYQIGGPRSANWPSSCSFNQDVYVFSVRDLNDAQWARLDSLIPEPPRRKDGRGAHGAVGARCSTAYCSSSGPALRGLTSRRYPPYQTCHRPFSNGCASGIMRA